MIIKRSKNNPILTPNKHQTWEAEAVFNCCPVKDGNKTYLLYRAISLPHYHAVTNSNLKISDIGITESKDGVNFVNRRRFITPELDWEKFGCEDPRITKLGNKYYIFYTALSHWPPGAENIKVGLAISDDLQTITEKHLVTPFNAKAMALFPEKINGKFWAILTANTDRPPAKICLASFNKESNLWKKSSWEKWYGQIDRYSLPLKRSAEDHIEVGAPPLKTPYGWLIFYSYIRNYFSRDRFFSVEAVLLDLKNPLKIIGKTDFPLLYPEEYYERHGLVPNIVFPTGAILDHHTIHLYYGAADTTCCQALLDLPTLIDKFISKKIILTKLKRSPRNPILAPKTKNSWEEKAVFNPAAVCLKNKVHLLYRAMSNDNTSSIGYATSPDGLKIDYRSPEPIYAPTEPFEQKLVPGGNSGAEDPRLIIHGSNIYMFYTAFNGQNPPRVALTSITINDFIRARWNWTQSILVSPPNVDDKDAAMFPEKFRGKFLIIHRNGHDIDLSFHNNLNFGDHNWLEEYRWLMPRPGWWDSLKVGVAAPPIKTKQGWIILYHGVSEKDMIYRVGAILTDLRAPIKIIGRTDYPIFEPETNYEKQGLVPNVVFPCGAVVINKTLFVYYGAADQVIGVATVPLDELIRVLRLCKC